MLHLSAGVGLGDCTSATLAKGGVSTAAGVYLTDGCVCQLRGRGVCCLRGLVYVRNPDMMMPGSQPLMHPTHALQCVGRMSIWEPGIIMSGHPTNMSHGGHTFASVKPEAVLEFSLLSKT